MLLLRNKAEEENVATMLLAPFTGCF